jgi:type IV pilus assembly protein PilX
MSLSISKSSRRRTDTRPSRSTGQHGVVLIVSLVMLMIISMLTVYAMRSSTSAETMANNVRITAMGTQSAEIALRYCEEATIQIASSAVTLSSVPTIQNFSSPPLWQNLTNWDNTRTGVFVVPATAVNQAGLSSAYNRAPECLVEQLPMANADSTTNTTASFVITARGFGPEVAAGTGRPAGSEVWLQSTLQLN